MLVAANAWWDACHAWTARAATPCDSAARRSLCADKLYTCESGQKCSLVADSNDISQPTCTWN